jgi:hypothetical protein
MKLADAGDLLVAQPPWLYWLGVTKPELTSLGWDLQEHAFADGVVRRLRGAKMRSTQSLFDEVAAALQFPDYFGENWDALDECLNDLSWLPGRSYLLVISDALQVLADEPVRELEILLRLLMRTGDEWANRRLEAAPRDGPPTPFHVVLQCPEPEGETLTRRMREAGARLERLSATG